MAATPPTARVSLYGAISANRVRTVVLVAFFVLIVGALGYVVGEATAPGAGFAALPFAIGLASVSTVGAYLGGDRLLLAQSRAREVGPSEEPLLRNTVEALAIGLGIPEPKLYVIEDPAPNAFATGRDPKHASVAVTRGLLEKLDRTELQGVIAHELSHVGNYDIRLMLLVAVLVGTVALLADWVLRSGMYGGRRRDRSGGGGIVVLVALAFAVLMPVVATLIRMAVSREREYLADASGALLTRYPQGLANALRKIAADPIPLAVANKATAALWIWDPLKDHRAFMDGLFSTHPPIEERVRRLEAMG